ncbi:MAG: hypothetical protein OXL38_17550 [Gammaproteobacteria bacterium]|nr:hypothetical protein [Gammaproteobacteria bacterium]
MFPGKRIAATVAAVGALLCATQHAVAGESGSFTAISVLSSTFTTLQQSGETVFAGPTEGASVITESSGEPFAVGSHTEMKCVAYGRISASGVTLEAPCTATASTNDKLYLLSKRTGERGRTELLGGTGMYDGIGGTCDYQVASVSPKVNVTTAKCMWNR